MWECVGMSEEVGTPPLTTGLLAHLPIPSGASLRGASYDRSKLTGGITHFGVGGFHRAHLALYIDDLAEAGQSTWSITGTGVMAHDTHMAEVLATQDNLYLVAERYGNRIDGRIVGSITECLPAQFDTSALLRNLVDVDTQIVSMTITESGYPVEHGKFVPDQSFIDDLHSAAPKTTFGLIVSALEHRHAAGLAPFTVMSCDNLPGNGDVVRTAVLGAAGLRSPALQSWLEANGAFPNSMVDRITPATTAADQEWATKTFGLVDRWPVICEPFRQWALEDCFVGGRPPFELAGAIMTSDVIPYEHMKLRLLNGSHTGLSYLAALAGITFVHDAVLDSRIAGFLRKLMKEESAPNLVAPHGIQLDEYQESLIERFSNPATADTVTRLCMDGTAKFPTFIVPSVEAQLANGGPIHMLALILAGWCRYLQGSADDGSSLALSHDPFISDAIEAARKSVADPKAFLQYERALGPNLQHSERLLATFSEALDSLESCGSLKTLELWVTR